MGGVKDHWKLITIILFLTTLVYANIFPNQFLMDDRDFILDWEGSKSLSNIPKFFTNEVPSYHQGEYRPITGMYYTISRYVWGEKEFGFHLQSIIMHLMATVLVFFIIYHITKREDLAFLTSLIFGVHPLHTEVVTYMTSTYDISSILLLGAFYCYLRKEEHKGFFLASMVLLVFSLFTYEATVIFLGIIFVYDVVYKNISWNFWKTYIPYVMIVGGFLFLRFIVLEVPTRGAGFPSGAIIPAVIVIKVLLKYISMAILPIGMSYRHTLSGDLQSYMVDNTLAALEAQTLLSLHTMIGLSVIAILLCIAFVCWKRSPHITFGLGFFFVNLLPFLDVVHNFSLFAERYAYVALMGSSLVIAYILCLVKKRAPLQAACIFLLLIPTYGYLTLDRNIDYRTEYSYVSQMLEHVPNSRDTHYHMGEINMRMGRCDEAVRHFDHLLRFTPSFYEEGAEQLFIYQRNALLNGAFCHAHIGNINTAGAHLNTVISAFPQDIVAWALLGDIYLRVENPQRALQAYETVLQINPNHTYAQERVNAIRKALQTPTQSAYALRGK